MSRSLGGAPARKPARQRSSLASPSNRKKGSLGSLFDVHVGTDPAEFDDLVVATLKQGSIGLDAMFDRDGFGVLHNACSAGNPGCVLVLLLHGCNPNIKDKRGITPLHEACFVIYAVGLEPAGMIMEILLMHGASVHIKASDSGQCRWEGRMSAAEILHASATAEPTLESVVGSVLDVAADAPQEAVVCIQGFEPTAALETALNAVFEILHSSGTCPRFIFCGNVTPTVLEAMDDIPSHHLVLQMQGQSLAQKIAACQNKLHGLSGRVTVVAQEDVLPEVQAYFEAICSEKSTSILPDWLPSFGEMAYIFAKVRSTPTRRREEAHLASVQRAETLSERHYAKAIESLRKAFASLSVARYVPQRVARSFILDNMWARANRIDNVLGAQESSSDVSGLADDIRNLAMNAIDDSDTEESDTEIDPTLPMSPILRYVVSPSEDSPDKRRPLLPWTENQEILEEAGERYGHHLGKSAKKQIVNFFMYNVALRSDNESRATDPDFRTDVLSVIRRCNANIVILTGVGTYKSDGVKVNFAEQLASDLRCEYRYSPCRKLDDGTTTGVAILTQSSILETRSFRYKSAECVPATTLAVEISIDYTDRGSVRSPLGHRHVWVCVTDIGKSDPRIQEQQVNELNAFLKTIKTERPLLLFGTLIFPKEERSNSYKNLTSFMRCGLCDILAIGRDEVPSRSWEHRVTYPSRDSDGVATQPSKRYNYAFCNAHNLLSPKHVRQTVIDDGKLRDVSTTSSHLPIVVRWI